MIKKDITLDHSALAAVPHALPVEFLARTKAIRSLARLYSLLLEEPITPVRTLRLLHAQIAAIAAICPAEMPVAIRLTCFAWAAMAICGCRKK